MCAYVDLVLDIIFTDPKHQGRGAGSMLVKWGVDKADEMGVEAGVEYAKSGKKASGYTDTGVTLIAAKPVAGVDSKDVKTGTQLCWGKK